MRIDGAFRQNISGFQYLSVHNLQSWTVRNQVGFRLCGLVIRNNYLSLLLGIPNFNYTRNFRKNSKSLRLSRLEKFLDTRKTLGNISTSHTSGMEGSHGKLCSGLTDGLCSNGSHCFTHFNRLSCCKVCSVALCANSRFGTAGQYRTNFYGLSSHLAKRIHNLRSSLRGNHVIGLYDNRTGFRIDDIFCKKSSCDSFL